MHWLSEEFGVEPLLNASVLIPSPELFPAPFTGTLEDAKNVLPCLCRQLQIDPQEIELDELDSVKLQVEGPSSSAVGHYSEREDGKFIIALAQRALDDPGDLIATLAHELGHRRLLGEKRMTPDVHDHEQMTDLLPVYFGMGIFGANAVVRESATADFWSIRKQGYLSTRVLGYALALFAWMRGERRPDWAKHLRRDSRAVLEQSLKYLEKTEDSLFTPATAGRSIDPKSVPVVADELIADSDGRKIAALWDLGERGTEASSAVDAVLTMLSHRSPAVRATALSTLTEICGPHAEAERAVLLKLRDAHPEVRSYATSAFAAVATNRDEAIDELTGALTDESSAVVLWAATALATFGREAERSAEALIRPIHRALVRCNVKQATTYLGALDAVHPQAEALLQEKISDPELFREAGEILRDLRTPDPPAEAG